MAYGVILRIGEVLIYVMVLILIVCSSGEMNPPVVAQQGLQSPAPSKAPALKLDSSLVVVPVTVTNSFGGFVKGLQEQHFEIYDEKVRRDIAFFSNDEQPVSVGIILDLSGSMAEEKIIAARQALGEFIQWSNPNDEFFLIGFNERVHLLRDFTPSADNIVSSVVLTEAAGRTAVCDAVYLGIEKVLQGRYPRRALLLISDGQDNASHYTYQHLRDLIKETDILIYSIGIFGAWESPRNLTYGWQMLTDITDLTGGRSYALLSDPTQRPKDQNNRLVNICQYVATELRTQYTIGFYPTESKATSGWRQLKVHLKLPKGISLGSLKIRARRGYLTSQGSSH
jgi:Ca-activated chloride channel family protein